MTQKSLSEFESSGVECPKCGKGGFDCVGDMKRHHVHAHGESIAGKLVECDYCGDEFRRRGDKLEENQRTFCSEDCYGSFCSEYYVGERNKNYKEPVTLECTECGDEYQRIPSEAEDSRFCSYECKRTWRSKNITGEDHPRWKGGKVECTCEYCGDTYEVKRKELERTRFCSYECTGKWRSENVYGPNHHAWEGGQDLIAYVRRSIGPRAWTTIAQEVREEADYTCELCGERAEGQGTHAHHIIPVLYGGTNHKDNIMVLCDSCHPKVESYTKSVLKDEFKITEYGGESGT